jgi:membrane protease YdiL (CAAX protease family)
MAVMEPRLAAPFAEAAGSRPHVDEWAPQDCMSRPQTVNGLITMSPANDPTERPESSESPASGAPETESDKPRAFPNEPRPEQDAVGLLILAAAFIMPLVTRQMISPAPASRPKSEAATPSALKQTLNKHPELKPLLGPDADLAALMQKGSASLKVYFYFSVMLSFIGVAIALWCLHGIWRARTFPLRGVPFHARPWGAWGILQALAALMLATPLSLFAMAFWFGIEPGIDEEGQWLRAQRFGVVNSLLSIGAVIFILRERFAARMEDLGLGRTRAGRAILAGAAGYVVFIALQWVVQPVAVWLMKSSGNAPDVHTVVTQYILTSQSQLRVTLILYAVICAPIVEELLFRGVLQGGLRRYFGPAAAIMIPALLFALMHDNAVDRPSLFLLAAICGYLYERTGSLYAPIALHVINNGLTMLQIELLRQMTLT